MKRKRYELSFDAEKEAWFIEFIETYRDQGVPIMEIIRLALQALDNPPTTEPPPANLDTSPVIADLHDQIAAMKDHQIESDAHNARLEKRLAGVEKELSQLRAQGTPLEDVPVWSDPQDDARQAALSAKLKRINFGGLTH
jgi:DNA-binding transcriptional MerR regulator